MIYQVRDSKTTRLENFDLDWLPPWAYDYVKPKASRSGNSIEVEAGPYVGAIPLREGHVLHLVPRAGRRAFSRMLLVTEGIEEALRDDIEEAASFSFGEGEGSWVRLLAGPFLRRLREIEKKSLAPGRQKRKAWLPYAKGAISVVPTLKAVAQGKGRPVSCAYNEKTYATPENRVLGAAARRLLGLGEVPRSDRQCAGRWVDLMQGRRLRTQELRHVVSGLSTGRYTGYRQYYVPALTMARLILSQASISFGMQEAVETESLLTNMPLLFERYVRKLLSRELSGRGYVVKKAEGGVQTRSLFTDGTCEMKPDVLVSSSSEVSLVADAKYKPGSDTESGDYYQLASYLDGYECQTGMLFIAEENENPRAGEVVELKMRQGEQSVYEVRLPLGDVKATEETLIGAIAKAAG